ncbi:hypothetical protein [Variovorax sp.]
MLIFIEGLIFGGEDLASLSGLMVGAIDDLISNIERQKNNINFAKNIFDKNLSPVYFFQLLHNACWVEGDWPKCFGDSAVAPDVYCALPSGTEIFDANEAYFVVVSSVEGILFAKNNADNDFVALRINVFDYVRVWEQARAKIIL